jgi:hypothetical protein
VGRPLLEGIGSALELTRTSVRWLTTEVARRYQAQVRELIAANDDRHPGGYPLPLLLSALGTTTTAAVSRPLAELRRRWTEILVGDRTESGREPTSAAIRDQGLRAFHASGPDWPSARWKTRHDADGYRYTSEFRLVCVDSVSYQRPGDQ